MSDTLAPPALPKDAELAPPPGGLNLKELRFGDAEAVAAADHAARHWTWPQSGPLHPGTKEHSRAVAAMFRETFNPYKPTIIDWPKLDQKARDRLVSLPIWNIAVQTEGKARIRMCTYADTIADPDWHAAVELNGWEEGRHKTVLSNLVQAYGIVLEPEPPYQPPSDAEWAYLVTGFSECIDSFFAFGLFALAKRSGFFPPELVDTFEPVMQEECRHILLFANWLAWYRKTLPWWKRPWFELRVLAVWAFLGWERFGIARGMDDKAKKGQDNNFTVTGSKSVSDAELSVPELMKLCLEENDRRFAGYDHRLLRPKTTPFLTRMTVKFMRGKKVATT